MVVICFVKARGMDTLERGQLVTILLSFLVSTRGVYPEGIPFLPRC